MANESRNILFGDEAQNAVITGIVKAARAVKSTLGPRGKNVIIQNKYGGYSFTKDGITVCKNVFLRDPMENLGAQIAKEAGNLSLARAGDGTSSTITVLEAIVVEGKKMISNSYDQMSIRRGIDAATIKVVEFVNEQSRPVRSQEELAKVATISANGDAAIGKLIATTLDKVGHDATVTLEEGKSGEDRVILTQGFEFDRGYLAQVFCNDPKRNRVVFEDAHVWLVNGKMTGTNVLQAALPILEHCSNNGFKLIIIAESVENEVLNTLALNCMKGALNVVAVRAPGYGDTRTEMLEDLAAATGATLRYPNQGQDLYKDFDPSEFGMAKRVEVYRDKTVIVSTSASGEAIEKRVEQLTREMTDTTDTDELERLRKRKSILAGGIANIVVGGSSEAQIKERRDLFEDALLASKCAAESGIVAGSGTMLVRAAQMLEKFSTGNHEQDVGVSILRKALSAPFKEIVKNGGKTPEVILEKILASENMNFGYDAYTDQMVDLMDAGIIDPVKVVISQVEHAASMAGLVLSSECVIALDPPKEDVK